MHEWIYSTTTALGYPGIALLMFIENVFPPLPSELIMPLAGFAAAEGDLSLVGVIAAGSLGALLGQLPFYLLGRWLGEETLIRWADRYGHFLLLSGRDLERPHLNDARVVDEHVQTAVPADRLGYGGLYLRLIADIGGKCQHLRAAPPQFISGVL